MHVELDPRATFRVKAYRSNFMFFRGCDNYIPRQSISKQTQRTQIFHRLEKINYSTKTAAKAQ